MGLVQALILVQDVGLWSGNRRKMEIAECHLSIPITVSPTHFHYKYRGSRSIDDEVSRKVSKVELSCPRCRTFGRGVSTGG